MINPPTELDLPTDIQSALDTNTTARNRFANLPPSHQREYLNHIDEAKKPETRARRIENMLTRLSAPPVPSAGQSAGETLKPFIGKFHSGTGNLSQNTGEQFTEIVAEKHRK